MVSVFGGSNRSDPGASEQSPFERPTLSDYSALICEQAGLRDLSQLHQAFCGDPGRVLAVRVKAHGAGYELERECREDDTLRSGWLVFEKLAGNTVRARAFKTIAGASAEFSARLSLQSSGDVTMREFETKPDSHRGRFVQIVFEGQNKSGECKMLLAPIDTALETATRLF